MASSETGVDVVPVGDPLLAELPAEKDQTILAQGVEIHQPCLESLEHAPDLIELLQVLVDSLGLAGHRLAGGQQFLGLTPLGAGRPVEQLL